MSESASALFSIADAGEFRFARFYIVCEEMPLGTPESPPIVSGVSGMRPSDCPNVEETRNPMQTFSWKKCSHFSPTNIPSAFPHEILKCVSCNITYRPKNDMLIAAVPDSHFICLFHLKLQHIDAVRLVYLHRGTGLKRITVLVIDRVAENIVGIVVQCQIMLLIPKYPAAALCLFRSVTTAALYRLQTPHR